MLTIIKYHSRHPIWIKVGNWLFNFCAGSSKVNLIVTKEFSSIQNQYWASKHFFGRQYTYVGIDYCIYRPLAQLITNYDTSAPLISMSSFCWQWPCICADDLRMTSAVLLKNVKYVMHWLNRLWVIDWYLLSVTLLSQTLCYYTTNEQNDSAVIIWIN